MGSRLFGLVVLAASLAFVCWIDTPLVRYSNVGHNIGCVANQLINIPRRVDFLAVGSSRVREGVDPAVMIEYSDHRIATAFNAGESGVDIARSYTIIKDLVDNGIVLGTVFVEMDVDAIGGVRKYTNSLNISYPGFIHYSEILDVASVMPSRIEAIGVASDLLVRKLSSGLGLHIGGEIRKTLFALFQIPAISCNKKDLEFSSEKREKRKEKKLAQVQEVFGDSLFAEDDRFTYTGSPSSKLELTYLEKLRELARRKGFKLLVSRHWGYADPPLSMEALKRIRALVPEFIYPDAGFVRQNSREFVDSTHMKKKSRDAYSRWLTAIVIADN